MNMLADVGLALIYGMGQLCNRQIRGISLSGVISVNYICKIHMSIHNSPPKCIPNSRYVEGFDITGPSGRYVSR